MDNKRIIELLKKVFYIYSKQLKRKKLYYFMKFVLIVFILKTKNKSPNGYVPNNNIFNKLFNDYILINKKKDNTKLNYFRNESKLYPFSPKIDSRFLTFSPRNTIRNESLGINNIGSSSYYNDQLNLNKQLSFFLDKNYRNKRNINEDIFSNDINMIHNSNNFSENSKINDNTQYNTLRNIHYRNPINLKYMSYKLPKNGKNISSGKNKNINKQISEYLKDFERIKIYKENRVSKNILNPNHNDYLSFNKDFRKAKKNESKYIPYYRNLYNNNIRKNLFNKYNENKIGYMTERERLSFIQKNRPNSSYMNKKNNSENKNKDNKNILKNMYSNKSLNPSSLGADQTKTFYTNKQRYSNNNNIKSGDILTSNINSASSKINEPNTHFLTGLKMISGVNKCFFDFNNKNDEKRNELSMQSLSDSKMFELAGKYIGDDENSSENFHMYNVIHSKKTQKIK